MDIQTKDDALRMALHHVEELEDAWRRGILDEHDGKGGTRSNRNVEVRRAIRAALDGATVSVTDVLMYELGLEEGLTRAQAGVPNVTDESPSRLESASEASTSAATWSTEHAAPVMKSTETGVTWGAEHAEDAQLRETVE